MTKKSQVDEAVIHSFHQMWDGFPGLARLINKKHIIVASNKAAEEKGFTEEAVCARVGTPESHKGCRANVTLKTQTAQLDRPAEDRVRGWMPVEGYEELFVHFTLVVPEKK